jgi:hypothetical protein
MYKVNVAISYGDQYYNAGDLADLSAWPPEDIERLEHEYRADIGQFVIERPEEGTMNNESEDVAHDW